MYILTKRATDGTQSWHNIHGWTDDPNVARAWYRSTRTTDVVELINYEAFRGRHIISEKRLPSWREQQLSYDKRIAELQAKPLTSEGFNRGIGINTEKSQWYYPK